MVGKERMPRKRIDWVRGPFPVKLNDFDKKHGDFANYDGKKRLNKQDIYKRLDEFIQDDDKVMALPPRERTIFYGLLAEREAQKGDFFEAAIHYGYKYANMKGKESEMWKKVGDHYLEAGNFEQAQKCYEKANIKYSIEELKNLQKKSGNSLEKTVNVVAICAAFLFSIILLSSNITGNTILGSSVKSSSIVGAGLFLVGLVASFMYVKRR
jgi:tetratricopeptide (TPR) repeat protein